MQIAPVSFAGKKEIQNLVKERKDITWEEKSLANIACGFHDLEVDRTGDGDYLQHPKEAETTSKAVLDFLHRAGASKFSYLIAVDLLNEIVPDKVEDDIDLIRRHPDNDNIFLAWTTSNPQTISPTGVVIPGYEKEVVTVTMEVIDNGYSTFFSKDVEVAPVSFLKLQPQRTIFGYYASYNFKGYTAEQLKCNVINLSFAYVNSDYTLDMTSLNDNIFRN